MKILREPSKWEDVEIVFEPRKPSSLRCYYASEVKGDKWAVTILEANDILAYYSENYRDESWSYYKEKS
jgi:hypothetical protein